MDFFFPQKSPALKYIFRISMRDSSFFTFSLSYNRFFSVFLTCFCMVQLHCPGCVESYNGW